MMTDHVNGWRLARTLGLLAALVATPATGASAAPVAQTGPFAHAFTGTLTLGNVPAAPGTRITAISARSASDTTVCGQTTVSDRQGGYELQLQPLPDCAGRVNPNRPTVELLFLVNGETVGIRRPAVFLDQPSSLGRVEPLNLHGVGVPPLTASDPAQPVIVRFYGTLTLSGTPAPQGTTIQITAGAGATSPVNCGSGRVLDTRGSYVAEVANQPACAGMVSPSRPPVELLFVVNGETVGIRRPSAFLDQPSSLGRVEPLILAGNQPPASSPSPAPNSGTGQTSGGPVLQGRVETSPEEQALEQEAAQAADAAQKAVDNIMLATIAGTLRDLGDPDIWRAALDGIATDLTNQQALNRSGDVVRQVADQQRDSLNFGKLVQGTAALAQAVLQAISQPNRTLGTVSDALSRPDRLVASAAQGTDARLNQWYQAALAAQAGDPAAFDRLLAEAMTTGVAGAQLAGSVPGSAAPPAAAADAAASLAQAEERVDAARRAVNGLTDLNGIQELGRANEVAYLTLAEQQGAVAADLNTVIRQNFPLLDAVSDAELSSAKAKFLFNPDRLPASYEAEFTKLLNPDQAQSAATLLVENRDKLGAAWPAGLPAEVPAVTDYITQRAVLRIPNDQVQRVQAFIRERALANPDRYGVPEPWTRIQPSGITTPEIYAVMRTRVPGWTPPAE